MKRFTQETNRNVLVQV